MRNWLFSKIWKFGNYEISWRGFSSKKIWKKSPVNISGFVLYSVGPLAVIDKKHFNG